MSETAHTYQSTSAVLVMRASIVGGVVSQTPSSCGSTMGMVNISDEELAGLVHSLASVGGLCH